MTNTMNANEINLEINVQFQIGEILYLVTDRSQEPVIVTKYIVTEYTIMYVVMQSTTESTHNSFELSRTKNTLLATTN